MALDRAEQLVTMTGIMLTAVAGVYQARCSVPKPHSVHNVNYACDILAQIWHANDGQVCGAPMASQARMGDILRAYAAAQRMLYSTCACNQSSHAGHIALVSFSANYHADKCLHVNSLLYSWRSALALKPCTAGFCNHTCGG